MRWADLADHITEELSSEGARPSTSHWLRLANRALWQMSGGKAVARSWGSSDYSFTAGILTLPNTFVSLEAIVYDGMALGSVTAEELDNGALDWRNDTGAPEMYVHLGQRTYRLIGNDADTSLLQVFGTGYLSEMAEGETEVESPLQYIDPPYQLLPADYVLMSLPADPEDAVASARQKSAALRWSADIEPCKQALAMAGLRKWSF